MSGVLPDTVKIPVNGYKRDLQPGNEDIRRYRYALWDLAALKWSVDGTVAAISGLFLCLRSFGKIF